MFLELALQGLHEKRMAKKAAKAAPKRAPKKKAAKARAKASPQILSDLQIVSLSMRLHRTAVNVYQVSQEMFGLTFRQEDFARLEQVGELFRCDECNVWCGTDLKHPDYTSRCVDCVREQDEDDE